MKKVAALAVAALGSVLLYRWWVRSRRRQVSPPCIWSVGWNGFGQLGQGNVDYCNNVVQVRVCDASHTLVDVSAGGLHFSGFTFAVCSHGKVWAWGANESGQLGIGGTQPRLSPCPVHMPSPSVRVTSVACGTRHAIFVCADGHVPLSVGDNTFLQLGRPTTDVVRHSTQPGPVQLPRDHSAIVGAACGDGHTALLSVTGDVMLFGSNAFGQVGATQGQVIPAHHAVKLALKAMAVACGHSHTLVLANEGQVMSFGSNSHGQLGYATALEYCSTPQTVVAHASCIAAGARHSLALREGVIFGWGSNEYAQLSLGEETLSEVNPQELFAGACMVFAGHFQSGAVRSVDGTVWMCGCNTEGQLGVAEKGLRVAVGWHKVELGGKAVKEASCADTHTVFLCE